MLYFVNDYARGAHPDIFAKLQNFNLIPMAGYGFDDVTESAKQKLKTICQNNEAEIHFLVGGTQTNMTIIKAMLAPYQGVISADTGHISLHEAGAIEASGHKILTLPINRAKSLPNKSKTTLTIFTTMAITVTWYFQAWSCKYPKLKTTLK